MSVPQWNSTELDPFAGTFPTAWGAELNQKFLSDYVEPIHMHNVGYIYDTASVNYSVVGSSDNGG